MLVDDEELVFLFGQNVELLKLPEYADRSAGERADVVIVGAGAAGLMAGIWAGRSSPGRRIVLLDGAVHLGAKILVAGSNRMICKDRKHMAGKFSDKDLGTFTH